MHNNNVGLGSVSILRLCEAENMLTAPRMLESTGAAKHKWFLTTEPFYEFLLIDHRRKR